MTFLGTSFPLDLSTSYTTDHLPRKAQSQWFLPLILQLVSSPWMLASLLSSSFSCSYLGPRASATAITQWSIAASVRSRSKRSFRSDPIFS